MGEGRERVAAATAARDEANTRGHKLRGAKAKLDSLLAEVRHEKPSHRRSGGSLHN